MASNPKSHQLHFVLFPFMAQGHMIPMVDLAKLLAQQGMIVTIITTPLNAKRFETTLYRAIKSGLQIQLIELQFPAEKAGLPNDCENCDMLPSLGLSNEFFCATIWLKEPVEKLLQELTPRPDCIISDKCLFYTGQVATKLGVPRIAFIGFSCFCMLCNHRIYNSRVLETLKSESEYFVVPDLPDHIELTKDQLLGAMLNMDYFYQQVAAAEMATYGIIINSFEEMESAYVQELKKVRGGKVWCIGPVSLCNKENLDKVERGNNKASIQEPECMNFLDSQKPGSVIYVCFGSLCNLVTSQLIELALGLEASNKPFVWVLIGIGTSNELETWIVEDGFGERTKERGLLVRGWAPQVAILSHPSIGGFLTHCGWNSILEAITAGIPMVTWPLFADQFCNERLVVDVLKVGVKVGVEATVKWGEEEKIGVLVKRENVTEAIERLMDGEESEERRKRTKELSRMAREAMEEKGSSYLNIKLLIQDIMHIS